jgi:hypothetical protein
MHKRLAVAAVVLMTTAAARTCRIASRANIGLLNGLPPPSPPHPLTIGRGEMSDSIVKPLYIYRDEDGEPIALAFWATGPNGGAVGVNVAKFPAPSKYLSAGDIRKYAETIIQSVNSFSSLKAENERLKAENESQRREIKVLREFKEAYDLLQNRLVGPTGLSGITVINDFLKRFEANFLAECLMTEEELEERLAALGSNGNG